MSVPPGMYMITKVFNQLSQAPHCIFKQPLSEAMDFVDCCVTLFFGRGLHCVTRGLHCCSFSCIVPRQVVVFSSLTFLRGSADFLMYRHL